MINNNFKRYCITGNLKDWIFDVLTGIGKSTAQRLPFYFFSHNYFDKWLELAVFWSEQEDGVFST